MKKKVWFILAAIMVLMTGCNQETEKTVRLEGEIHTADDVILIKGKSDLPTGAMLIAELKSIQDDSLLDEEETEVHKNGTYSFRLKRGDRKIPYKLQVSFLPDKQPGAIKKSYGEEGEYIDKKSDGYALIKEGNKSIHIIRLYGLISDIHHQHEEEENEPHGNQLTSEFMDHLHE